jgi:cytochrome b6-f complex iron-sulfur subunit
MNRVTRFVERVARQRRPRPFRASPDDARVMRMAVDLAAAARPPQDPSAEFVAGLHDRLARQLDDPAERDPARTGPLRTRRGLVRAAGIAAVAGGVGAAGGYLGAADHAASRTAGHLAGTSGGEPVLRPASGAWRTVARSDELPADGARPFSTGPVVGFVGRAAGRLFAVSGICTHQGCRLALDAPARQLQCPCHAAAFTLTGAVIHHPRLGPLPPLPRLPVRERDGTVQVFAARPEEDT